MTTSVSPNAYLALPRKGPDLADSTEDRIGWTHRDLEEVARRAEELVGRVDDRATERIGRELCRRAETEHGATESRRRGAGGGDKGGRSGRGGNGGRKGQRSWIDS